MEQRNENALLNIISTCVRSHLQNSDTKKASHLTLAMGVSHPTSNKILNPEKETSGGVAVKHWLSALEFCDLVETFIGEIESKAKGWHRPIPPRDPKCSEEAIYRLTAVAKSFVENKGLNVNNISYLTNVSYNTAKAMTHYSDASGGVAIKSWLKLLDAMEVSKDLNFRMTQKILQPELVITKKPDVAFDQRRIELVY